MLLLGLTAAKTEGGLSVLASRTAEFITSKEEMNDIMKIL